jgi:hypothetical protein
MFWGPFTLAFKFVRKMRVDFLGLIVLSFSTTFEYLSAMQNLMLIQMSPCRALYYLTLASCARFAKCIRTYAAPCTRLNYVGHSGEFHFRSFSVHTDIYASYLKWTISRVIIVLNAPHAGRFYSRPRRTSSGRLQHLRRMRGLFQEHGRIRKAQ